MDIRCGFQGGLRCEIPVHVDHHLGQKPRSQAGNREEESGGRQNEGELVGEREEGCCANEGTRVKGGIIGRDTTIVRSHHERSEQDGGGDGRKQEKDKKRGGHSTGVR